MPFTFRLEPLISIRNSVLKEKQASLAQAFEWMRIIEEERLRLEQDIASNMQSAREMLHSGKIDANFLLGVQRLDAFLSPQLEKARLAIVLHEEEIERRRQAVLEANKDLKIIEKLKEREYEKYLVDERRKETIEMDEIAGRRKVMDN